MIVVCLAMAGVMLLCYAAAHDIGFRTVPNKVSLLIALIGLIERAASGDPYSTFFAAILAGGIFFVLIVIWLTGRIGAGDVKLWSATSLLFPPIWRLQLHFFFVVLVIGGLLGICYLIASLFIRRPEPGRPVRYAMRIWKAERWRIFSRRPLPYAVAIASAAILLIPGYYSVCHHEKFTVGGYSRLK